MSKAHTQGKGVVGRERPPLLAAGSTGAVSAAPAGSVEAAPERRLGAVRGALLVCGSMLGLGIFTTTGLLLRELGSRPAVLIAWALGGLLSLCGALAYAELAAMFPFNGGEYQLLSRIYGRRCGFVAGWVSLWVGFSAPTAAAALAFGEYLRDLLPRVPPLLAALLLILSLSVFHAGSVRWGSALQALATALAVLILSGLILSGLVRSHALPALPADPTPVTEALASPAFGVALVYVTFAYSGWNAIVYLAGEMREPSKSIPRSLIGGTLLTTGLYLGLNLVFLKGVPPTALSGAVDVAWRASLQLSGLAMARAVAALICLTLALSTSALLLAGPRVYEAMARDDPGLRSWLGRARGPGRGPLPALLLQAFLSVALLFGSSFDAVLAYAGVLLSAFSALTIAGVFVLRRREPGRARPYRAWGHPWTSGAALTLNAALLARALMARPALAWAGLLTVASGLAIERWLRRSHVDRSLSCRGGRRA